MCCRYHEDKPSSGPILSKLCFLGQLYSELPWSHAQVSKSRSIISTQYYQHSAARFRSWWSKKWRLESFFIKYFEGNRVSSFSFKDPMTVVDGWKTWQSRKYKKKIMLNYLDFLMKSFILSTVDTSAKKNRRSKCVYFIEHIMAILHRYCTHHQLFIKRYD